MEAAGWRSTEFLLVRHGQTSWNAAGVIQGQADAPLDETGRSQAQALGAAAASGALGAIRLPVLSSDLRAADTARALADHLRGAASTTPRRPPLVTLHPELREHRRGLGRPRGRARDHRDAFRRFGPRRVRAGANPSTNSGTEPCFLERVAASEPASEIPGAPPRLSDGDGDAFTASRAVAASTDTPPPPTGGVLRVFAARCARDAAEATRG